MSRHKIVPAGVRRRAHALPRPVAGRLIAIAAFSGTAMGGVMAKGVYAAGATPVSFLSVRLLAAVLVLGVIAGPKLLAVPRPLAARLTLLGSAFGLQTLAYYGAVAISPVALVVVVVSVYPTIVIVIDAVRTRTRPSSKRMALMGMSLFGLWLAAGSPSGAPDLGVLLGFASALIYAFYMRFSEKLLPGLPPIVATWYVMTGGLALMLTIALLITPPWPSLSGVALAGLHGIVSTALPVVGLYAALQRIRSTDLAAVAPLEPVLATLAAVALLGERLTLLQVSGGVLVVAVVALLSVGRDRLRVGRLPVFDPRRPGKRPRRRATDRRRPAASGPAVDPLGPYRTASLQPRPRRR